MISYVGPHIKHQITRLKTCGHIPQHLKLIGLSLLGYFSLDIIRFDIWQTDAIAGPIQLELLFDHYLCLTV
ncbi:hypothetical protein D9M71_735330 [compost metagenome]